MHAHAKFCLIFHLYSWAASLDGILLPKMRGNCINYFLVHFEDLIKLIVIVKKKRWSDNKINDPKCQWPEIADPDENQGKEEKKKTFQSVIWCQTNSIKGGETKKKKTGGLISINAFLYAFRFWNPKKYAIIVQWNVKNLPHFFFSFPWSNQCNALWMQKKSAANLMHHHNDAYPSIHTNILA